MSLQETEVPSLRREPGQFSVLMATEGTYPFHRGGVSTWCDVLLQGLPEVDFTILALMMNPFLRLRYKLPPNVVDVIRAPLWGVEEPMEFSSEMPFSQVYEAKRATTDGTIEAKFIPMFRAFTREIQRDGDPTLVGMLLYNMNQYFTRYDYNITWRSQLVWEAFREEMIEASRWHVQNLLDERELLGQEGEVDNPLRYVPPSILEATDCLRWLYRFLSVLSHPVPRTDIVHSAAAAFCAIPCIVAKQAYGSAFLLTEHGVYLREQYLSLGRGAYSFHSKRFLLQLIRSISRCCYRWADVVAPVCRWNTRWERRYGVTDDKIQVIYNGVDPDRFAPMPGVARDRRPTVVTMALIYPLKDIGTLLRAASLTRERIPDVQFQVYGGVPDETYYQSCLRLRERLNLEDSFHFMGRTSNPEEAYNKGDVIALSSLSEAFPFSVVEAMMCGKPIVATDVGGVSEALGPAGIVVPARNSERFAEGLIKLLEDSRLRAEMGEDARNRALAHFSIDRFIADHRTLYAELLQRSARKVRIHAA